MEKGLSCWEGQPCDGQEGNCGMDGWCREGVHMYSFFPFSFFSQIGLSIRAVGGESRHASDSVCIKDKERWGSSWRQMGESRSR